MKIKNIITVLAFALLPLSAFAWGVVSISGGVAAAAGASYNINQNFEGTGYDNSETWTESTTPSSYCDEDYTTSPLRGSQMLHIGSTDSESATTTFNMGTGYDEFWGHMLITFGAAAPGDNIHILSVLDASDNVIAYVTWLLNGYVLVNQGTSASSNSAATATGNTYHLWWHYKNDGTFDLWLGATTTRPASTTCNVTGGSSTAQVRKIRLRGAKTSELFIDQVLGSSSDFTTVSE